MEEGSSPHRNLQPLLRDESAPAGPRMGAYAPPASHHPPPPPQPQPTPYVTSRPEDYDLQLTTTDATGQVLASDDEDLPPLPPLISYCSYVRYACSFGKWLALIAIVNVIAIAICVKARYFDYDGYWPVDSWKGVLLASVWLATAIFFYLSAKVVEMDVQRIDHMAQYEQGRLSEGDTAINASFIPNYEHVYGQVSRKIDASFTPNSLSTTNGSSSTPPPEGTSSLVNLSFAFWAVSFGAAVFLGTGVIVGKHYAKDCDGKNLPPEGGNSTNSKSDFANIKKYSSELQDWITERRDPWGYGMRVDYQDDFYEEYGGGETDYNFPTSYSTDVGSFASMKDGTVFFAGLVPEPNDEDTADETFVYSNHLVLVESPGNGGPPKYYKDIVNPRMFIPVANTLVDDKGGGTLTATQYCFTSAKDEAERKKAKRTWENSIRMTPIHCIITKANDDESAFEIKKMNIAWKDKTQGGNQVSAAAAGGEILVAHVGTDGRKSYFEVVALNVASMEGKAIYHLTTSEADYYGWESEGHENTRCIQDKVMGVGAVAAMVVLVLCGLWLILREGVPAGVAPIMLSLVGLIRCFTGEYDQGMTTMSLTFGALFFHGVLCCGDGRVCHLPAWIGRDMYIWGLYSWILSFFFMDVVFRMSDAIIWASIFFALSGVILNHPILHLMGIVSICMGILEVIMFPFFGRYSGFGFMGLLCVVLGLGMIAAGNCLSNNRRYCVAACRPVSRAGRTMFYGSPSGGTTPTVVSSTAQV